MKSVRILIYLLIFFNFHCLFSQTTVQHWMIGAQGTSNESVGSFQVYQSIGQQTVTNTGTAKDFIQQGFQQSNWGTIVSENTNSFSTNIFPNPFTDFISVKFSNSPGKTILCEAYDMQGRLVFSQKAEPTGNVVKLDLRQLVQSQYLLRITGENYIFSQMILKK